MASSYQQQVNPGAFTPLSPGATGADFGGAVGAGVANLGQDLSQEHDRTFRLNLEHQQDQQSVDWANKFSTLQGSLAQSITDLRGNAAPGGAGHVDQVLKTFDDSVDGALEGISNPQVKHTAQMQIAAARANVDERETMWAAGQRVTKLKTDATDAVSTMSNNARMLDSPLDVHSVEEQSNAMIDGLAGVDADAKATMKRGASQQIYSTWLQGLTDRDPNKVINVLDHGALNDVLEPKQIEALRSGAEVQVRRADAQARAAASLGKTQAEAQISVINSKLGDGIEIPDAELAQAQQTATAYGLDDKAYNLGAARVRQGVNIETRSWTPVQYQDEMQRLAALKDPSEPDQVRLDQLRKISGTRISQFHDDPGGYAASNGAPPPSIDMNNGDGFADRAQWRQGVQNGTGTWTPTLSKEEAAPFVDKVQHGTPADKLATAQWISSWGSEAPNVLKQLDPNRDSAFSQAVTLGSSSTANMRDALTGPEALKAMGGEERAFKVNQSLGELTPQQIFGQSAARALMARGPQFGAGALDNAQSIYASVAQRNGWTQFHPGEFQRSIYKALGGREVGNGQWVGGLGSHNGVAFVLPSNMTQSDFDGTLARAGGSDLFHAGTGEPVFADGRTVHAAELKAMIPVSVGDGRFAFRQGNTYVQAKHGGPYVLDMSKLSR